MTTDERLKKLIEETVSSMRLFEEELDSENVRAGQEYIEVIKELLILRQEKQTKDAVIASLTEDYIEENELLRQEKQDLIENAERLEKSLRFAKDYIDEGDIDYGNCDDALDRHTALIDKETSNFPEQKTYIDMDSAGNKEFRDSWMRILLSLWI